MLIRENAQKHPSANTVVIHIAINFSFLVLGISWFFFADCVLFGFKCWAIIFKNLVAYGSIVHFGLTWLLIIFLFKELFTNYIFQIASDCSKTGRYNFRLCFGGYRILQVYIIMFISCLTDIYVWRPCDFLEK